MRSLLLTLFHLGIYSSFHSISYFQYFYFHFIIRSFIFVFTNSYINRLTGEYVLFYVGFGSIIHITPVLYTEGTRQYSPHSRSVSLSFSLVFSLLLSSHYLLSLSHSCLSLLPSSRLLSLITAVFTTPVSHYIILHSSRPPLPESPPCVHFFF